MRFYAICIFVMMSFMANAATCPNGYSELSVNENDKIVPMDEQCPDGTTEVYTVSDCSGANAGSVCAVCDGGALTSGGTCATLCSVGSKKINFGKNLSFDLLSDRPTKPSLNISMGRGKVCYVGLESGADKGLNFKLPGDRIYHATNASSGGYRVCRAEHTLSYVCNGNTVDKQVITDGGWYTLPSASVCNLPAGKRFGGWYLDGVKQDPYKINTYNYATDKQIIARFLDGSAFYNVNYHCLVNTAPVYTDMATIGANNALKNVCQNSLSRHSQVGWFTPIKPEYINRLSSWCYDNFGATGECDTAIEQLTEVMQSPEESWVGFYFGNGYSIFSDEWSMFFWAVVLAMGQQALIDASSLDEELGTILLAVALYEHTWLDPNLMDVGDIGQQVVNTDKDIDLYAIYVRDGYTTIDDCGVIAEPYYYLFEGGVSVHYNEEFELEGSCSFFVEWSINNQTDGGFGYAVGNTARFVGWEIDGNFYAEGDKFIWDTYSDKNAIGIYDFNLHATFDCGADGVLTDGDADVKYSGRGNGNDMIPLNISAVCTPNDGKRFVGWMLPYHDITNPKGKALYFEDVVFEVGDTLDWLDVIYAHDQTIITKEDGSRHQINKATDDFIAVYEDVE